MKRILVEELKAGMRFSKPVYIDGSNMLAGANVPIKEADIKRLMKWGIREIMSEGELVTGNKSSTEVKSGQFEKVLEDYNQLISLKDKLLEIHGRTCKELAKIHTAIRNERLFHIQELTKCVEDIHNLLKQNRNVFLFLQRSETFQDQLVVHCVNSAFYAMVIGLALKYSRARATGLGLGVLLLNSGMIQIPAYIIDKEENLSDRELTQIRSHPLLGYQALKSLGNVSEEIAVVSLQHHENFNGGGYPKDLTGIEISEYARIASIADNYEAMAEKKSYRPRQSFYKALKQLVANGSRFDPVILRMFISVVSAYPIGSLVEISNGKVGVVIGTIKDNPMRPVIKVILDEDKHKVKGIDIINLVEEHELYIKQILDENKIDINLAEIF